MAINHQEVRHFTDLTAWKLARKLRMAVYEVTKSLPKEEKYGLSLQMKKAAISCTANIAEGYGRFHYLENIQFCRISRGSMYETQDHLISCLDNNYINESRFSEVNDLAVNAIRVANGYIRYLKKAERQKN